jgi:WD40 repeat protein
MIVLQYRYRRDWRSVDFSPDGTRLLVGGERGAFAVWNLDNRKLEHQATVEGGVQQVCFWANEVVLVRNYYEIYRIPLGALGGEVSSFLWLRNATAFAYSLPQECLCQANHRRELVAYERDLDAPPRWVVQRLPEIASCLAWSGDGQTLAAGLVMGGFILFGADGQLIQEDLHSGGLMISAIALSPDGQTLVWAGGPRLYHRRDGKTHSQSLGRTHFLGLAFHPSGAFYATAKGDGTVDFWDAHSGERRESFDWGLQKAWGITFDPSGDRAAACGKGGKVVVWDVDY